jgi:glycosyltransferase involved in cell wall biosynthesis
MAVISRWFPTVDEPLAGIFVRDWIQAVEGDVDCDVLVPSAASLPNALRFLAARGPLCGRTIVVPVAGLPLFGSLLRWLAFERAISRLPDRPQLIHVHELLPDALPALVAARRRRVPLVVTEHADFLVSLVSARRGKFQLLQVLRRADAVIAVSPTLERQLLGFEPRAAVHVIPNPVDIDRFHPGGSRVGDFALSVAVSPGKAKGTDTLLRAWAQARSVSRVPRLVIVGDGPELPQLQALASELGLAELCSFVGRVAEDELAELLRSAAFVVSASRSETFGRVVVEALASGTPAIATDTGIAVTALGDVAGIVVPVDDVEALAAAVVRMTDSAGSYDPHALHRRALELYGYHAVGAQILALYESVL